MAIKSFVLLHIVLVALALDLFHHFGQRLGVHLHSLSSALGTEGILTSDCN